MALYYYTFFQLTENAWVTKDMLIGKACEAVHDRGVRGVDKIKGDKGC